MNDWKLPWAGGCRCEETRFTIGAPPLLASACHCSGCQRMTASAFSLSLAIPAEGFSVSQGEPVIGGVHGATQHFFCRRCKSWLFTRPEGLDHLVNVRVSMLDDHSWFEPFVEFWTREKLWWVTTPAVYSFASEPEAHEFPRLIEKYRARGARPGCAST
jgi:hypothetical protein